MSVLFPDYCNSILNVAASVLHSYGAECRHPGLPWLERQLAEPCKNRLVLILDGLGSSCLNRMLPADSFLRSHCRQDITSVYPCTTAAATTTLLSGLSPLEHGWLGWSAWFREFGRVVDLLLDRDSYSGATIAPSPARLLLPYADLPKLIAAAVPAGLQCHQVLPSFAPDGFGSLAAMVERIREICRLDGQQLILGYWHEPDTLMHNEGPWSEAVRDDLQENDRILGNLYADTSDIQILVTADHGQIEVTREVFLDEIPDLHECLILPPSLESRAVSLFVKPARKAWFAAAFRERFGDCYLLLPREEVLERGLFGPGQPHRKVDDFLGDFLACATGQTIIRYHSLFNRPRFSFKGHHAGLCPEEMTVPLIWAAKKAASLH